MSGLIETDSSLAKTAINDNLDARSVCSSVCSSIKNTELIMAAFSTQPLTLTIEEENVNSQTEASFSAGSFTNSQKSFINNSNNSDPVSEREDNSTEYFVEELSTEEPVKVKKEESGLVNKLLDDTIADVASGSISKETTKAIADKQKLMIKHSKAQEKHYYQLKKLREKEQKKRTSSGLKEPSKLSGTKP